MSVGEVPVPTTSNTPTPPVLPVIQPTPIQSYAHDNLQKTEDPIGWTLTVVDADGTRIKGHNIQHKTDTDRTPYIVQSGQRYRLTLNENTEAWAASTLSLAEGELKDFTADDDIDNSYFLTFSEFHGDARANALPSTVPAILHAHNRTHDGRIYDVNLRFSGRPNLSLPWARAVSDVHDASILKARSLPQLSQPRLDLHNTEIRKNDQHTALNMTLALTDISGQDFQVREGRDGTGHNAPQVAWRLSTCLESRDQGTDACQHEQPLTFLNPEGDNDTSFKQDHHRYRFPDINLEDGQLQQLFVRVPQTNEEGEIRGYHQRWYTLFDPQHLFDIYYDQEITQGVTPLLIRPILWEIPEVKGLGIQSQNTTLQLTNPTTIPTKLEQAILDYNANASSLVTQQYSSHYPDRSTIALDDGIDQHLANSIVPVQQIPSFITSSKHLPLGTYNFHIQHQIQTTYQWPCFTEHPTRSFCIAHYNQIPWEPLRSRTDTVTETITVTVKAPAEPPYATSIVVDANNLDHSNTLAPGIQWQALAQPNQTTQLALPYAFHVWDSKLQNQRNTGPIAWYRGTALSPTDQAKLQNVMADMGYQAITQRPRLCPTTASSTNAAQCTSLPLYDSSVLQDELQAYTGLQADIGPVRLTFELPTLQTIAAKQATPVQRINSLASGEIQLNAKLISMLAMASMLYVDDNRAWQLISGNKHTAAADIKPGDDLQDATLYVRMDTQPTQVISAASPQNWLRSMVATAESSQHTATDLWSDNALYLALPEDMSTPFCLQLDPTSTPSIKQDALRIHTADMQWNLHTHQDRPHSVCLDAEASQEFYQQLHNNTVVQLHLPHQGQGDTTVRLYSQQQALQQMLAMGLGIDDPLWIIEEYDIHHPPISRKFQTTWNFQPIIAAIQEKFALQAADIDILLENIMFETQYKDGDDIIVTETANFHISDHGAAEYTAEAYTWMGQQNETGNPLLNLEGIPLNGDSWQGQLHISTTITLNGHTFQLAQPTMAGIYPYLDPKVRLSWESYHSQRPLHQNTLSVLASPSLGQTLDINWLETHLLEKINRYYNPVLERLYTEQDTAQKVQDLMHTTLTVANAVVNHDKQMVWVHASRFPELGLHLLSPNGTAEEMTLDDPIALKVGESQYFTPEQIAWIHADVCLEQSSHLSDELCTEEEYFNKLYFLSGKSNLFIGLSASDAERVRAFRDIDQDRDHTLPIENTMILYRASDDFTTQLAAQEKDEYGADIPQIVWDDFSEKVKIDWEAWKDNIKYHSRKKGVLGKRSSYDQVEFVLDLTPLKRINNGKKGDEEEDRNEGNNPDKPWWKLTPKTESNSFTILVSGEMHLLKEKLMEEVLEAYKDYPEIYNKVSELQKDEFINTFALGIPETTVECTGVNKKNKKESDYRAAIQESFFYITLPEGTKTTRCKITMQLSQPKSLFNEELSIIDHKGFFNGGSKANLIIVEFEFHTFFSVGETYSLELDLYEDKSYLELKLNSEKVKEGGSLKFINKEHIDEYKYMLDILNPNRRESYYDMSYAYQVFLFQSIWKQWYAANLAWKEKNSTEILDSILDSKGENSTNILDSRVIIYDMRQHEYTQKNSNILEGGGYIIDYHRSAAKKEHYLNYRKIRITYNSNKVKSYAFIGFSRELMNQIIYSILLDSQSFKKDFNHYLSSSIQAAFKWEKSEQLAKQYSGEVDSFYKGITNLIELDYITGNYLKGGYETLFPKINNTNIKETYTRKHLVNSVDYITLMLKNIALYKHEVKITEEDEVKPALIWSSSLQALFASCDKQRKIRNFKESIKTFPFDMRDFHNEFVKRLFKSNEEYYKCEKNILCLDKNESGYESLTRNLKNIVTINKFKKVRRKPRVLLES